jgi:ABC-type uncharacterized transport system substrate-binding protein
VLKWTAANSRLPDFGFWIDRVHYGTLAAMTVSEREQGLAAGRLARAILIERKSPSKLPMQLIPHRQTDALRGHVGTPAQRSEAKHGVGGLVAS